MDLRGKRVLLTGDSHLDWSAVGSGLEKGLKAEGAIVTRIAIGGTWTPQWLGTKPICRKAVGSDDPAAVSSGQKCARFSDIEAQKPYDLVIFSLGGNDAANADVKGGMKGNEPPVFVERIKKLAAKIGAPFLLIGIPVQGDKVKHYTNAAMLPYIEAAKAAFGVSYFDPREVTAPYAQDGDGVHYKGEGAKAWVAAVIAHVKASEFSQPDTTLALPSGGSSFGKYALFLGGSLVVAILIRRMRRG